MALIEVSGSKSLKRGVEGSGVSGIHEQSGTSASVGEIKYYKDKNGEVIAAYVADRHKEYSGEALIETGVTKDVGEVDTIGGVHGVITKWEELQSNEDVTKVSYSIREVDFIS